jgi:hypothetical protein
MKDKVGVSRGLFFELNFAALPTKIFMSRRHQDLAHSNILVFKEERIVFSFFFVLQQINQGSKIYLYIFYSILRIIIMQSNKELSICDHMRKILSIMTKIFMVSLVCLCVFFTGNEYENQKHLFIEVSGRCVPHNLSMHCAPYKRILC